MEDPAVVQKRTALNAMVEKIQKQLKEYYVTTTKEIDQCMAEGANMHGVVPLLEGEKDRILHEIVCNSNS